MAHKLKKVVVIRGALQQHLAVFCLLLRHVCSLPWLRVLEFKADKSIIIAASTTLSCSMYCKLPCEDMSAQRRFHPRAGRNLRTC